MPFEASAARCATTPLHSVDWNCEGFGNPLSHNQPGQSASELTKCMQSTSSRACPGNWQPKTPWPEFCILLQMPCTPKGPFPPPSMFRCGTCLREVIRVGRSRSSAFLHSAKELQPRQKIRVLAFEDMKTGHATILTQEYMNA